MKKYVRSSSIINPNSDLPDSDLYGFLDETIFDIENKCFEIPLDSYEDNPELYKIAQKVKNILDSCCKDLANCLDIDFYNYYNNKDR